MDKSYPIFILSLFLSLGIKAQRLKTDEIIDLSEKYLTESVGHELIQYFDLAEPNGSYYKLQENRFGYNPTKHFKPKSKLKKNWTEIWVHWNFNFPKIKGVQSGLWVKLNKKLKLLEPIKLNFIPSFVWENRDSDFISIEQASEIGNRNLTKTEYGKERPKLRFDDKLGKYVYEISNKKTQKIDSSGKKHGVLEIVKLDALNGKFIETNYGYYGKNLIR